MVAFVILAKSADWLVEAAIEIAQRVHVPPMLIGIVLVSLGTTAPELAVSVNAALSGQAAMALGNAVGSVIYDDGIALPLAVLFAPAVILIDRTVLRSAAIFLIAVDIVAYILCLDGTLGRWEGSIPLPATHELAPIHHLVISRRTGHTTKVCICRAIGWS